MRARGWWVAIVLAVATSAAADPKPKPVDIKPIRDQLIVLTDADGGIYIAQPGKDARLFFGVGGKNKNVYEQIVISRSSDGTTGAWDVGVWAPRISGVRPGTVGRQRDGTYIRWCGGDEKLPLTEVTGDKAKTVLDKSVFLSSAMIRRPHLLARDDAAVYYYVDVIRDQYGGKGYRVFIGKKGAMKQKPLTDVASDTAGDVFATKTGDLRIVRDTSSDDGKNTVTWVKGEKRQQLFWLDVNANSSLIFKDLGIYGFTGSICESI
jgi:hypothetical protein